MGQQKRQPKKSIALMAICALFASRQHPDTQRTSPKYGAEIFSMGSRQPWKRLCCRCLTLFLLLIITTSIIIIAMDSGLLQYNHVFYNSRKVGYEQYYVEYPHKYHFIINEEEKCEQLRPFLVLMVPVAPHNLVDRDTIRRTWGKESLILGKAVSVFFLLGLSGGEGQGQEGEWLDRELLQESIEHGDLLQSDFLDCYKNLTIKTMVMMEWLDAHCSGASYAMKIDSDMFLNVPNLVDMLLRAPRRGYMTGLVETDAEIQRDPRSKWYMPVEVLPQQVYPRYALGLGYVMSLDLPRKLVEASRHVRPLYVEDVHLGFCMKYLGIDYSDPPKWNYFNVNPVPYDRCGYSKLIATTTEEDLDRIKIWEDFNRANPICQEDNTTLLMATPMT